MYNFKARPNSKTRRKKKCSHGFTNSGIIAILWKQLVSLQSRVCFFFVCVCVFFFFTIISHRIFIISHVRMRGSAGHSVILLAVGRSYSTENCRGLMKVNGKKCSRINDLQAHAHAFLSGFKLMCKVTCGCGTSYCLSLIHI